MLKSATPYMITKSGKLIDVSPVHPYIKYIVTDDDAISIIKLINNNINHLYWFYNNVEDSTPLKHDIELFLCSLINSSYFAQYVNRDTMEKYFDITSILKSYKPLENDYDIIELFKFINNTCNQEFLRLRTSNMRFGGNTGDVYFRISSINYNWFNTIWEIVYNNKDFITSVTISTDTQARGGAVKFYQHNGVVINQLPTEEFINLSGNPIVEQEEADQHVVSQLFESQYHPYHTNRIIEELWDTYVEQQFTANDLTLYETIKQLNMFED